MQDDHLVIVEVGAALIKKLKNKILSYQVMGTWIYCWLYYIRG